MRQYAFEVWDVFTSQPLSGNPLAVFTDARGLSDREMLAIAREINHSETTFVFPKTARGYRVRIFTPQEELPFAGHPVLGTAASLHQRFHEATITLDLNIGAVPVTFDGGYGEMAQPEPVFTESYDRATVAHWIGLDPAMIADHPLETVSTGRPNIIVAVKSLAAIRAVRMDWAAIGSRALYLLSLETENPRARAHARKLTPRAEDPATGSAAGCAAAWMVKHSIARSGERVLIEQGGEIQRPSELYVSARRDGERVTGVRVGGHANRVMEGNLALP